MLQGVENMAEKTNQTKRPYAMHIPEETREHFKAAHQEFHETIKTMLPPEFLEHRNKAKREMLLAFRSLIDHSIAHMEEHEKKA
jgi:hypothetical protein